LDRLAQKAATAVMRYFDTSARHHHDDEEHDLFPALIESMAGSGAICLRELTAALTAEHREPEARWQTLRVAIAQVAAGQMVLLAQADLSSVAQLYVGYTSRAKSPSSCPWPIGGCATPNSAGLVSRCASDVVCRATKSVLQPRRPSHRTGRLGPFRYRRLFNSTLMLKCQQFVVVLPVHRSP
jgi:hypothetical protein